MVKTVHFLEFPVKTIDGNAMSNLNEKYDVVKDSIEHFVIVSKHGQGLLTIATYTEKEDDSWDDNEA